MTTGVPRRFPIGAEVIDGGVHFRVWAPAWSQVTLVLEEPEHRQLALRSEPHGYHALLVDGLRPGARYRFRLGETGGVHADPASRYQPEGPFGPSEVVDPGDTAWTDGTWRGVVHPHQQVLYEMHVGTFTPEGTWAAAARHLPFLRDLGITTVEMMPVNEFAGRRGWGYDGVDLFAPYHHYGTPAELRQFVDRAHALGLAVILDVVYNHLGPAGNSLFAYAPEFRQQRCNEWGDMLDFTRPGVRQFFITNATYWIDEFHFDGLRIDATQAIVDAGDCHILREINEAARAAAPGRRLFLVGENEPQDTRLLRSSDDEGCGLDALWNDDFEHAARVALTGSTDGYYHDYRGSPQELVSVFERGFLYQGQAFAWQGNTRGTSTRGVAPARLVNYLENHDQVANLGFGDRLTTLADPASLRAMTAVLLLAPQIPMLFQGQETGTRTPFRFFVDHDDELNQRVRRGRAAFLAQFARLATPQVQALLPDPADPATFATCILDPTERTVDGPMVRLHRDLLRIRREHPCFTDQRPGVLAGAVLSETTFCIRWFHETGDRLLLVNLGRTVRENVLPEPLLAAPSRTGWRVAWSSEHPMYGGYGTPEPFSIKRLYLPARSAVLFSPDPAAWLRVEPPPASGQQNLVDPRAP